jgi:RNA polymerase sigma-70 factor (ECF subfamily)
VYGEVERKDELPVEDRPPADDELVERARGGDAHAFGALVTRHQELAFRIAWLHTRDAAEAEDATQEAFVKAWRALPRFRPDAPFRPWLCRIVANEAKNRARGSRRRAALTTRAAAVTSGDAVPSPEDAALTHEEADTLLRAVDALPERDRLVVAYRWLLGLTEREVADALGVPAGTVKSRLSRAMTKLRTQLAAADEEVPA